jgi:ATP-dependent phosphoenolpyruvate carboxykinase
MIYLTYSNDYLCESTSVKNVWLSEHNDLEERYGKFLLDSAKDRNIEINPHWHNLLDWQKFNSHLTETEYNDELEKWDMYLKTWSFDVFVVTKKLATKQKVKNIFN